ncbi:MAG: amidohydrolase family protein [Vicinamibacterales bacterium]
MRIFERFREGRRARLVLTGGSCVLAAMIATSSVQPILAQVPADLIIRNGLIVNENGRMLADVRIRGEKIVEIGQKLAAGAGAREIDATNMLLLPGAIDTHTHLNPENPVPPRPNGAVDDYVSGSSAALAGGITTVSNFLPLLERETAEAYIARITGGIAKNGIADFFIHVNMGNDPTPFTKREMFDKLAAAGFVSTGEDFLARESFDKNSLGWLKAFRVSGETGVVSMLHAEDYSIMAEAQERLAANNGLSLHNFPQSAPIVAEVMAVQRGVAMAEATGAPMYILHMSSGRALKVAEEGMKRGLPIYVETRPMYLHLTSEVYARPDVGLYIGGPPLRDKWDLEYIWDGIRRGTVHTIGTDHSGYTKATKLDPTQNILNKRMGINNLQDYRPMMFSEGVVKGRITLEQFVAVTSTNAAKIFGMYPRKGVIQVGADADIVIWDPAMKKVLKDEDQFSNAKFSSYAGMEVTGFPKTTIRRGEVAYDNGKIVAKPGSGKFIPGDRFQRPTLRPVSD